MALTVGLYTWPQHAHAVAAVVALTAVNYVGIQESAWLTRAIVATVLAVLAAVVIASLSSTSAEPAHLNPTGEATPGGVLQAAGLLFFAFAGYARIAVLAIGAAAYGIRHGTSR
jgi:APA family basic amino acid/polyamine antiporter